MDPMFWPLHTYFDRYFHMKMLTDYDSMDMTWADSVCDGHSSGDIMPFVDLFGDGAGSYTNAELLEVMNPALQRADSDIVLPWVYASLPYSLYEQ
jgi:hypothetical protein